MLACGQIVLFHFSSGGDYGLEAVDGVRVQFY